MTITNRTLFGPSVQEVEDIIAQHQLSTERAMIKGRFIESLRWAVLGSANSFHTI